MLIALAGDMTGYNGSFPFNKPGDNYEDTPYIGMRIVSTNISFSQKSVTFVVYLVCSSIL